jgi:hypothetical protein
MSCAGDAENRFGLDAGRAMQEAVDLWQLRGVRSQVRALL